MKALSRWAGSVLNGLYIVVGLAMAVWTIIRSDDPLGTALNLFLPAMVITVLGIGLLGALHFLKARMSGQAFWTLNISVAAALLLVSIVGWRIMERYGDDGTGIAGGWNAMQALLRSGHVAQDLIAFSIPPLTAYLATAVISGLVYTVEKTFRGDALWIARIAVAALVTFMVVVAYPASIAFRAGQPVIDQNLILSLLLWLGMVVPTIGVAIAYRKIGDGRS